MIPVADALQQVLAACPTLPPEEAPLDRALGRILREEIVATSDHPSFDRVMMDGYALRAADVTPGGTLPVAGESAAGASAIPVLPDGACIQVMTGGPLPSGADAVVKVEDTARDGERVTFHQPVRPGQHFATRGEEAREGQLLLAPGDEITPVGIATIATTGRARALVSRRPSLAIVSTGDELVPVEEIPGPNQIRDTNRWSLRAQALAEGLTEVHSTHARDDETILREAITTALEYDVVVISGGVSMGKYDLVPGVLAELGVETRFHKVFQKPGKPVWFGTRGDTLVFGAPGNPLSTVVTFHIYVRAALARMTGRAAVDPRHRGVLQRAITYKAKRNLFAFAEAHYDSARFVVTPLPGAGSADVFAPASANALICLPAGTHPLEKDEEIEFLFLGPQPGGTT